MYSSAQSEVTKLKQTINAEKRTVQQLFNKRDNLITSYQIVAKDYIATNAKKDSLSQKPNSPAYKNAVKKAEKLLKERTELLESIEQIKQEIDSINLVITDQELKLQQLQSQKTEAKKEKKTEKNGTKYCEISK
jgi:chromosome segregation ATPase